MIFECPICLDNIKYATVGSCMHHFCYYCLLKHCKYNNKCPLCKTLILELKYDREFDLLLNNDILPHFNYKDEIILNPIPGVNNPGLTIQNNLTGVGVIITKINLLGLFHKYSFEVGDILLFINNIPCNYHADVMEQIMSLYKSTKQIKIIKLKRYIAIE